MIRNPLYVYGEQNVLVPADMHLGRYVLDTIYDMKEDIALTNCEDGSSYTYGDIAQQAVDLSLSLARVGVTRGTMVAVCSEPRAELLSSILGILCAGATVVSVNGMFHEDIVQKQLSCAKPTILFTSTKFYHELQRVFEAEDQLETIVVFEKQHELTSRVISLEEFLTETALVESYIAPPVNGLEDVALISFSSGTTGPLKGIQLTHYNLLIQVNQYTTMKRGEGILFLWHWSTPFSVKFVLGAMCSGAHLFTAPQASTTPAAEHDVSIFYNYIERHKIRVLQVTGLVASNMLAANNKIKLYDLSSLKMIIYFAVPLDVRRLQKLKSLFGGAALRYYYGMSETGQICSIDFTDENCDFDGLVDKSNKDGQIINSPKNKPEQGNNFNRLGIVSVGRPSPGVTLKITDLHSSKTLGPNLLGEICVKTRALCLGYNNKKMELEEGWFHTGDAGCIDTHGWLYLYDRITDLIHIGGSIISPSMLEVALGRFPGVRDAAVALREDKLTAFIQPLEGATVTENDLQTYVENLGIEGAVLAGGVRTVSRIPRSLSGKMDRRALREL